MTPFGRVLDHYYHHIISIMITSDIVSAQLKGVPGKHVITKWFVFVRIVIMLCTVGDQITARGYLPTPTFTLL